MDSITLLGSTPKTQRRRRSASSAAAQELARAVARATNFSPSLASFADTEKMGGQVASVLGPYRNGSKWRVVLIEGDRRQSKVFASHEEALSVVKTLSSSLAGLAKMSIGAAIDEHLEHKRRQGLKPVSLRMVRDGLTAFLPLDEALSDIDPRRAQAIYDQSTENYAVATHRIRLRYTRAFFSWAVERGYLRTNPFSAVKPIGRPRVGKQQLRIDEARVLYSDLLARAQEGDDRYLGLLTQLLTGLRSGEVLKLRARDVDDGGARLCVAMGEEGGKTRNATRALAIEVPELQALLVRQREGRKPDDLLFGSGQPLHSDYLWDCLTRACKRLGLPHVCPHSLRGLHATLAVSRGATSGLVAGVLGHGSDAITKRHYIAPGSVEAANARNVSAILAAAIAAPTAQKNDPAAGVIELLRNMSESERAAIFAAVAEKR